MDIGAALRNMSRRLQMTVGRAVITLVKDSGALQLIQAERLAGEIHDDMERFGSYGLASWPKDGAEAIVLSVAGVRSHAVVIAVEDRRYRLKLEAEGEVAIYDDLGQVVHLKRDGISIESSLKVDIVAPQVTVTADATTVTGDAIVKGNVKLGGEAPTQFIMLADMTPSTKVKAL